MISQTKDKSVENNQYNHSILPIDTVLSSDKKQYIISEMTGFDDETTSYLCKNKRTSEVFFLKEFFPRSICYRDEKDNKIHPIQGREVQFKTLLGDIDSVWEAIKSLNGNPCLVDILHIFKLNNTVYTVCEKIDAKSIYDYLEEDNKPFIWAGIKQNFLKLCSTVNTLHSRGIIHRGISDKTVYMNEKNEYILTSISTVANRTANSEISATLFEDFSAPEQYSPRLWQGTWTDIYSLGCLLYKLLTGKSIQKDGNNNIIPANKINPNIPEHISDAISSCTISDTSSRTQCIDDFTAMLLEDTSSNTTVFNSLISDKDNDTKIFVKNFRNEMTEDTTVTSVSGDTISIDTASLKEDFTEDSIPKKNDKKTTIALAIILLLLICGSFFLLREPKDVVVEPENQSSEEIYEVVPFENYKIDNFVGEVAKEVLENKQNNEKYKFYVKETYNDTYKRGQVVAQSPGAGTLAVNKVNIIITVSKGARTIVMPDVNGMKVGEAIEILNKYGLKYKVIEIFNESLEPGIIRNTNFDVGSTVDIFDDEVLIFVNKSINSSSEEPAE